MVANTADDAAESIAVVGMAGRFPGAADTDALWRLLMDRGDAIGPVPADRWDASASLDPEREIQGVGGFLKDVDRFDAAFFGISPREAAAVDPQQRLILHEAWRALEDAGVRASDLEGTRTGVYVGASWHDYELLREERAARPTPHSLVGNALDVIAARVSYVFGLRGPSLTVETGCSSSLVALHLAAQALRQGEIEAALVGGVNLMLDPHVTIGLTHFGALSPDGRCATFSAHANGFVRGEGVAVLHVKTLERALADGDRVHAVIPRTVVNNDGGGESLVTPSPEGQRDLLTRAYGDGVVPLDSVAYIEAHGTGTGRGDPIEVTEIGRAVARHRTGGPLAVGSVKTNIGHLEAAAGMAGLFKILLALRHRTVPPSLHSAELNPGIPFDDLNLHVVREPLRLPAGGTLAMGVNSFGWGGTNAHVIAVSPPEPTAEGTRGDPSGGPATGLAPVVPLSAKDPRVLARRAAELGAALDGLGLADVAGTLARRRDHFPVRAAFLAADTAQLAGKLDVFATGGAEADGVTRGRATGRGRTAFVFPGQGSQWSGMGRELYRDSPLFADVIHRCRAALAPHVTWDLLDVFTGDAGDAWTTRIDMLQPTLWAMSLALAEVWRASGVEPDVVLGHSQGEITAATLAGILSLEDAALVMARRSAIAMRTSGQGRMLAVDLDREAAAAALEGFEDSVSLAVHNGPNSCVLSGEKDAVLMLKELLEADGTYCRLVNVDYASHSPQMDPLEADLLTALGPAAPREGTIALMSTVRCQILDGTELDAAYWVENLRSPVLFADAMEALLDDGVTHVVEISPHPVLAPAVEQLGAGRERQPAVLTTLRRHHGSADDFALALAEGYVSGLEPFGSLPRTPLAPVPGYPLEGDRHWTPPRQRGSGAVRGFDPEPVPTPGRPDVWQADLELALPDLPWLADHRVYDTAVLPGAGILTLAVHTARARLGAGSLRVDDVVFHKEVAVGDDPVRLAAEWHGDGGARGAFRLLSLPSGAAEWTVNATARVAPHHGREGLPEFPAWYDDDAGYGPAAPDGDAPHGAPAPAGPVAADTFYDSCAARGLHYGPAFRCVRSVRVGPDAGEAVGEVVLGERLRASNRPHVLHPALWDGALQVSLSLSGAGGEALVPTSVRVVRLLNDHDQPVTRLWSHAVRRPEGDLDVIVFDEERKPLLLLEGLTLRPLPGGGGAVSDAERLHRVEWTDTEDAAEGGADGGMDGGTVAGTDAGHWLVVGETTGVPAELTRALEESGAHVVCAEATPLTGDGQELDLGAVGAGEVDGVVFVAPGPAAGHAAQRAGLGALAAVVRGCVALGVPPRLTVVTDRAQGAGGEHVPDPGAAQYWGFTRVLRREHGELEPRLVDVVADGTDWARTCAAEILGAGTDDQVVLRGGRRLTAGIVRGPALDTATGLPAPRTVRQPFAVRTLSRWTVDCVPLERRPPGPGEIEIEISATALDETDVRTAGAGSRPPRPEGGTHRASSAAPPSDGDTTGTGPGAAVFGHSCAGVVVAAGPDTGGLAVGDRVVACAPGALASHLTAHVGRVRPIPDGLGDEDAAGLVLPLVTAWHALTGPGRLRQGETVLVHTAGDGLGLAAVRVAQELGARVIASAATTESRARFTALGVGDVFDSADPYWHDRVRAATGGRGADIVLGPLTGTAVRSDLELLAPGGRFVDTGDHGPGGGSIGLDALRGGVSLATVDIPALVRTEPERFARLLRDVWDLVAEGRLEALPVRRHSFADVPRALRDVPRGERVVLTGPKDITGVTPVPLPGGRLRADGTYLISGGLGALGLSLAESLARAGAGHLVLLGRSAPPPEAELRLAALRVDGTRVETVRCDVGDRAALDRVLAERREVLPPLRGVVHAAGLLDDATVLNVTSRQLMSVLTPKADGARNLDAATEADPLDFFVLFSSAATLVGNAGQAVYAAGNSYLDAVAESRRRRGRPALSVQWGPVTDVGLAADANGRRGARLAERGMGGITAEEVWPALVRLLDRDEPVVGYVPIDLRQWFDAYPDTAALKSWERLRAAAQDSGHTGASGAEFRARLRAAASEERVPLVEATVRELAGRVLRVDSAAMDGETPFKELGLDSLMSLELRNRLEAALGLKLSPTLLWSYGSPTALAGALAEQLLAAPSEER
ncbi:SDR family NAD(P)-dependent oxidoreductase [Streptomyces sp. NPDC006617]|uniref:SDR family NAD(P)-dependent oxidoreductase n=1 Tax=Streptomyces sp. NPDC006617 TaxID=3155354 RepID=UPI0033BDEA95